MAIQPTNDGLITENAQQYYSGAQGFRALSNNANNQEFVTTFNTELYLGSWNQSNVDYGLNNFKVYTSETGLPNSYTEWLTEMSVGSDNRTLTLCCCSTNNINRW